MFESLQRQALSICAQCIPPHKIWPADHNCAGFLFPRVTVDSCFPLRPDRRFVFLAESGFRDVDHVITRTRQLYLREVMDEIVVAAMRVDQHDLFESVASDLAAGILEQ